MASGPFYRNSFAGNDIGPASSNYGDADAVAAIEQNVALFNGDGFWITGAGDQMKSNTANRNHRWGINAPIAVDLGGSKESGNASSPDGGWPDSDSSQWVTIFAPLPPQDCHYAR